MPETDQLRWLATDRDGDSHAGWVYRRDVDSMIAKECGPESFWGFQVMAVYDTDRETVIASYPGDWKPTSDRGPA